MLSQHAVICKRTGEGIGMKMDGGTCVCPSANECRIRLPPKDDQTKDSQHCREVFAENVKYGGMP